MQRDKDAVAAKMREKQAAGTSLSTSPDLVDRLLTLGQPRRGRPTEREQEMARIRKSRILLFECPGHLGPRLGKRQRKTSMPASNGEPRTRKLSVAERMALSRFH